MPYAQQHTLRIWRAHTRTQINTDELSYDTIAFHKQQPLIFIRSIEKFLNLLAWSLIDTFVPGDVRFWLEWKKRAELIENRVCNSTVSNT